MAQGPVLGVDAKLYYDSAGMSENPTWTELTNVTNVTLTLEKDTTDVTTRAAEGWRQEMGTLKNARVEFTMVWDGNDAGFQAIRSAYLNNTNIALAVLDGDVSGDGEGIMGDFQITGFTREEPIDGALTASVTAVPAYNSDYPISWHGAA